MSLVSIIIFLVVPVSRDIQSSAWIVMHIPSLQFCRFESSGHLSGPITPKCYKGLLTLPGSFYLCYRKLHQFLHICFLNETRFVPRFYSTFSKILSLELPKCNTWAIQVSNNLHFWFFFFWIVVTESEGKRNHDFKILSKCFLASS